jgi:hypothetical protein
MKCAYCGGETNKSNLTKEHIPPKSFFLKGSPNLLTIPVCLKCNNDKSSDDEKIKTLLFMTDLISNSEYKQKTDSVIRGLVRPQKSQYVKELLDNVFTVYSEDTNEIKYSLQFDNTLLNEWCALNAQGLLFHEGLISQCNRKNKTFLLNLLSQSDSNELEWIKHALAYTKNNKANICGKNEFKYWINTEDRTEFLVIQCFYEEFYIVSLINKL